MKKAIALSVMLLLSACNSTANVQQEPETMSIVIKGSDTEVQLVSNLAEAFIEVNPDADISVTGGGSATGIASLINGEIDLANSSRLMSDEEREQAFANGIHVREFILARDGLSVITHPTNPVKQLTVEQIGKIYSGEITNWKDVGGPDEEIVLYGRQSTSGTYGFFRDTVVKNDYSQTMRNMEGSQAIVDAVASDTNGIGYVGVGYVKDESGQPKTDIAILEVASTASGTYISPFNIEAVMEGRYPIFRRIYQYVAQTPAKDSLMEKFLQFEASPEGEEIIEAAGFYSLTPADKALNDAFFGDIQ